MLAMGTPTGTWRVARIASGVAWLVKSTPAPRSRQVRTLVVSVVPYVITTRNGVSVGGQECTRSAVVTRTRSAESAGQSSAQTGSARAATSMVCVMRSATSQSRICSGVCARPASGMWTAAPRGR
ncbi:hypothetical protein RB196_06100 [Streptomyces sp. PmtA]